MQSNIQDTAAKAVELARKHGAQSVRTQVERQRFINLVRAEGELERIEESSEMSLTADLFVDGRYSSHKTTDLRPKAMDAFLENAVAMTRYLAEDKARTLPPPELYKGFEEKDLKLLDSSYESVDTRSRTKVTEQLEAGVDRSRLKLSRVESSYYDTLYEWALVNSNGFSGYERGTQFWTGIDLTADGEEDRKVRDSWFCGSRFRDQLPDPTEIARKAQTRVEAAMGAKPMKTFRGAMIVENRTGRRLFSMLKAPMSGWTLQQKQSFLEGKRGEMIGSPAMTLVDDPTLLSGTASGNFDAEGMPTRRRVMIEGGLLREYWLDVYYANKLGMPPTSGRPSNVTFVPGDLDIHDLMKKAGKGILVRGFLGGNSNNTTGDFSLGIHGHYFENGEIVQPVQEMNIAGNHLEFWKQLSEFGNDPYPYGSYRTPSVLFDGVLFSGV